MRQGRGRGLGRGWGEYPWIGGLSTEEDTSWFSCTVDHYLLLSGLRLPLVCGLINYNRDIAGPLCGGTECFVVAVPSALWRQGAPFVATHPTIVYRQRLTVEMEKNWKCLLSSRVLKVDSRTTFCLT